ncbi:MULTISPECIES: ABC transporter ATP-binding protein [unclassified Brevundimonas]|uniref:ABC transporter ATP-binding protein n=1 Tax=unclassified Brevundimonas TaxID=2622653 RepID=UPI003F93011D
MTEAPGGGNPVRLRRHDYIVIIALGLGETLALVAVVFLVWIIVDRITASPQTAFATFPLIGGLGLAVACSALLRALQFAVTEKVGLELVRRLRLVLYDHMSGMAPRQIQHRSRGSLILRLTGDLTMLRTWISRGIGRGVIAAIIVAGGTLFLGVINIRIALVVLAIFVIGLAASAHEGKRLARLTRAVRRRRSLVTSNLDEQISALAVVQLFGRSRGERSRLSRQNDAMTRFLVQEANIRGGLRGISAGAGWAAVLTVLALGAFDVSAGRMSIGALAAAITVVRYMNSPVRNLGFAHDYWRRAQISQRKIQDFLKSASRQLEDPSQQKLRVRRGMIEFEAVSVAGALAEVTATAQAGEQVAILGAAGAGKSTLLGLVARMVDPLSGQVRIDGQCLADCTLVSTFRYLGVMSPDLPLMRGSIRRNLTYRNPAATEAEINHVVMICNLDEVFADLPGGIDGWVTEGGLNLSVGQRQLLALGRAMLGHPPILLLDEPLANLDPRSQDIAQDALRRYLGTILLVTHDPATAEMADQIWLLDKGRLVSAVAGDEYRSRRRAEERLARRIDVAAAS